MTIPTLLIEQDPKNDMRFRITLSEERVTRFTINKCQASVHQMEDSMRYMKRQLGFEACERLKDLPARQWASEHGGRAIFKRICFKPAGRKFTPYRAGLSITFKERDKAMLFKLMWMNVQDDTPLAFAA